MDAAQSHTKVQLEEQLSNDAKEIDCSSLCRWEDDGGAIAERLTPQGIEDNCQSLSNFSYCA